MFLNTEIPMNRIHNYEINHIENDHIQYKLYNINEELNLN